MTRKYKRGDILISNNKKEFLHVIAVTPAAGHPYLCDRYNVEHGLNGQDDYTAVIEKTYKLANTLEKKIFLFIYNSDGGLEGIFDSQERKLFVAMCNTNGSVQFSLTDKTGANRKFRLRSDKNDCGTRHILFKHFLGTIGCLSYSDVMKMPYVIQKGEVTTKGSDLIYTYKSAIGRKTYQLICFIKSTKQGGELLIKSFYSNKKRA